MQLLIPKLNGAAVIWFSFVGHAAWQASLLAVLLLAVVGLGRRWPSPLRYWLLVLALAKFALPPVVSMPTGLFSYIGPAVRATPSTANLPAVSSANLAMVDPPEAAEGSSAMPIPNGSFAERTSAAAESRSSAPVLDVRVWLMLLHAAGAVVVACWILSGLLAMRRTLRRATEVPDGELRQRFFRLSKALGMRHPPRLLLCREPCGPAALGVLRPVVVLPDAVVSLDASALDAILAHELAHHRRRDPCINWLQLALTAVWWFNPLLWIVNRQIRKVREDCCDDLLLTRNVTTDRAYCDTLLNAASRLTERAAVGVSLGFGDNLHPLGRRLERIMDQTLRRAPRLSLTGILILALLATVVLPGLRRLDGDESPPPAKQADSAADKAVADGKDASAAAILDKSVIRVTGRALSADGRAVAGARVVLVDNRTETQPDRQIVAEVTSAADGSFDLGERKSAGVVLAVHPDYAIAWANLAADATHDRLTLRLTPPQSRAARVTDEDGRPLAGAHVWLIGAGDRTGTEPQFRDYLSLPHFLALVGATTGEDGFALVHNLPNTGCNLAAELSGYADGSPAMHDDDESGRLDRFRLSKAARVSGKVVTAEGEPVVGARVTFAADWKYWAFWHATTDQRGRYAIDGLPGDGWDMSRWGKGKRGDGRYRVSVASDRYLGRETQIQLKPGESRDEFDFTVTLGTVVKCRVIQRGSGKPMPNARLGIWSAAGNKTAVADDQGLVTYLVPRGDVQLNFLQPGPGVYIGDPGNGALPTQSLNATGLDAVSVRLDAPPIEGRLVTLGGDVVGPDGRPLAGAVVQPAAAGRFITKNVYSYIVAAPSNDDGTFELVEVPAGRKLLLFAETRDRKAAGTAAVDVPAEPDESFRLHLKLQPTRRASVSIADSAGGVNAKRSDMPLQISPIVEGEPIYFKAERTARTDAEGRLEIDGILPGLEYLLREMTPSNDAPAEALGGAPPPRKTFEKRLRLVAVGAAAGDKPAADAKNAAPATTVEWPEGATVMGRVLDHRGAPVANAVVLLLGKERVIVDADRRNWFALEQQNGRPASARTDKNGAFTITRKQGTSDRLGVIADDPLFWVVSRKSLSQGDNIEIKLPASGSLAVHCDLPGKPPKMPVMVESKTFDGVIWNTDWLRFHMSTFTLDNPGETLFEHLAPGQYAVQRQVETKTGPNSVLLTGADRELVQIESAKRANVRFERKTGRPLSGQVRGLEDVDLRYAYLTIHRLGPEEVLGNDGKLGRMYVAFDVIPITSDGRFTTDPIPPGKYTADLFAVLASAPQLSSTSSDFSGNVSFTVPVEGELPKVEFDAKATAPRDLSKVTDLRVRIVDEDGKVVPKAEAMVNTADQGCGPWTAGRDGWVFLGGASQYRGAALQVLVRADGYASAIEHFTGAERDKLSKGETTITLRHGQKIQLQFNLPAGMTWPTAALPEVYFDDLQQRVRMMRQPSNRRDGNLSDFNMLNLKPVGEGRFEFQVADDTPRFHVAVHVPGFLQFFETGPFTLADVKNKNENLQVDVPRPAMLDVSFEPGDHADAASLFKSASLDVMRQLQGNSYLSVASAPGSSLTPRLKLTDLAPGHYLVDVRTQPQDNREPLPGTEINAGAFFDRKMLTLKDGQIERIDFRSVPYDANAFRGTRKAVVRIRTPDGKPAKDRNVSVTRFDGHYGSQVVFSGTVPGSGEIVLTDITDAKLPASYSAFSPYQVSVDGERLGSFGFTKETGTEQFDFALAPGTGDMAPDVSLTSLTTGKETSLKSFRGKVVFLEFWATWCGPCQQPMSKLNALGAEQGDAWKDQVAIVPVSIDSEHARVRSHVREREWTGLEHFLSGGADGADFESPAARAFVVSSVPQAFLIGRDGRILWRGHPLDQTDGMDVKSRIEHALK
jgi:beta-lactamase regulating signal transducer with metallopeptidase domain/thiol-disulfide isomerase/thioredoxin